MHIYVCMYLFIYLLNAYDLEFHFYKTISICIFDSMPFIFVDDKSFGSLHVSIALIYIL